MPSFKDLPWLPVAPTDLAARCKLDAVLSATAAKPGDRAIAPGLALQSLATARLTGRQSLALVRTLKLARERQVDLAPLAPLRLAVLSNANYDVIADYLPTAALRHGVNLDLVMPPFDQAMQQALDPASQIYTQAADCVLLAFDHRWYGLDRIALDQDASATIDRAIAQLDIIIAAIKANSGMTAIVQTVPVPPAALFGSLDAVIAGTLVNMVDILNRELAKLCAARGTCLHDAAGLARRIGTDAWFDAVSWAAFRFPFAADCFAAFAETLGRLLGAMRGKARKCLVLDLDNTLWGGVIGDDGLDGIVIARGDAKGEGHLAVQQLAKTLRARGILLAVSSKNDEAGARTPFENHPEMILRTADITVFQANWLDKPSNLEAIASQLNIGVDALVMLDDNPAERAQIRAALPMVAVPELPDDAAWFAWYLEAAGYFEASEFTRDDLNRAASYTADAQRAEVMVKARDLGAYLDALGMVMRVGPFDPLQRKRIVQLANKTNQFNLTTRRYTEADIEQRESDPDACTLQANLSDNFGDIGLIALVIARPDSARSATWTIESWLMSCRVLGRQVEAGMLCALVDRARRAGIRWLEGEYLPTAKNAMVAEHYARLGFSAVTDRAGPGTRWRLDIEHYAAPALPMEIHATWTSSQ